jgi:hypothetical protein
MRDDKAMSVFEEVTKSLFGDAVDSRELFAKFNPDGSSLHVNRTYTKKAKGDRRQRMVTAGLSATGAAAGAAGLGVAARDIKEAGSWAKTRRSSKVLLPLEVAGLGGEIMATKLLHHDVKAAAPPKPPAPKKPHVFIKSADYDQIIKARRLGVIDTEQALDLIEKVSVPKPLVQAGRLLRHHTTPKGRKQMKQGKAYASYADNIIEQGINHVGTPILRRAGYVSAGGAGAIGGVLAHKHYVKRKGQQTSPSKTSTALAALPPVQVSAVTLKKSITWEGEISKVNEEKHQVFGWATVTEVDGQPVVDRQNDLVSLDEIEKAAYEYVISSRVGGDQHQRAGGAPYKAADLIESFLVTDEKLAELGIEPSQVSKRGWWMGFHVKDDRQWELIKKGGRTGFSIHGKGHRTERDL